MRKRIANFQDLKGFSRWDGGCLIYVGYGGRAHKYGLVQTPLGRMTAHRASYTFSKGPIPAGMNILHRCDTPRCINPEHLFAGTQQENIHDMMAKGRRVPTKRKIEEPIIRYIHQLWHAGTKQADIAKACGVSLNSVWKILNGQRHHKEYLAYADSPALHADFACNG